MRAVFRGEEGQLFPYGLFKSKQFSLVATLAVALLSPMTPHLPFTSLGGKPPRPPSFAVSFKVAYIARWLRGS